MRWAWIACCLVTAAVPVVAKAERLPVAAGTRAVSFTAHGPAVLHAGPHAVPLAEGAVRVELSRDGDGWLLAVGDRTYELARRPALRIAGGRATDRVAGRGAVSMVGARLLAKAVIPGWLPGRLARTGAWMRGMPAAALWRMGELDRRRRATWWRRAAVATLRLRGSERADTHDIGFMYGEGAAYGYDVGCRGARRAPFGERLCRALHESARSAADRLALMIRANGPANLLPTQLGRCPDCPPGARETIVDSMMNVGLLVWAERRAGRGGYASLATRHAHAVADTLIRPDGCTAQATFTDVASGRTFGMHTHQGLSASSTWARGQGWAMLGFARLARDTGDPWALRVTRALTGCWLAKAPREGLVRFDLDAHTGPPDSSAQAVAAAGLAILGFMDHPRAVSWRAAARTQLEAAEEMISTAPPLGHFGGQTYVAGGDESDDNVELPIAPLYVLDARARLLSRG